LPLLVKTPEGAKCCAHSETFFTKSHQPRSRATLLSDSEKRLREGM
jgi:hypothetical protein